MIYSTNYYIYTLRVVCPFCGHGKDTGFTRYELQSLLTNFKPCKPVLCSRCERWFTAAKHSKLCGKNEKCFECLFAGAAIMKFSRILKRYRDTSCTYTTAWCTDSTTSNSKYVWDSSTTSSSGRTTVVRWSK